MSGCTPVHEPPELGAPSRRGPESWVERRLRARPPAPDLCAVSTPEVTQREGVRTSLAPDTDPRTGAAGGEGSRMACAPRCRPAPHSLIPVPCCLGTWHRVSQPREMEEAALSEAKARRKNSAFVSRGSPTRERRSRLLRLSAPPWATQWHGPQMGR